mmetsp:Transcript_98658/g.307368  ORF Transcript_98658/g.307368 Transcript_98658/m.307368 type:complete len:219 (+) Transcript_98658:599-1255(+)
MFETKQSCSHFLNSITAIWSLPRSSSHCLSWSARHLSASSRTFGTRFASTGPETMLAFSTLNLFLTSTKSDSAALTTASAELSTFLLACASWPLSCNLATSTKMLSWSQNCTPFMMPGVRIITTNSFKVGSWLSGFKRKAAAPSNCGDKTSMAITMTNFMHVTTPNQEKSCRKYLSMSRCFHKISASFHSFSRSTSLSLAKSGWSMPPSPGVAGAVAL